eukprot:3236035-Amphidinium_carterae.2
MKFQTNIYAWQLCIQALTKALCPAASEWHFTDGLARMDGQCHGGQVSTHASREIAVVVYHPTSGQKRRMCDVRDPFSMALLPDKCKGRANPHDALACATDAFGQYHSRAFLGDAGNRVRSAKLRLLLERPRVCVCVSHSQKNIRCSALTPSNTAQRL